MPAVAIIGAGPGGSAAAIILARAGLEVLLFESRPFPRAKVCGEFISPSAGSALERVASPKDLRAWGATRIGAFDLSVNDRRLVWPLPAAGWGLSRGALDAALLARARDAGAAVIQPALVRKVEHGPGGVTIITDASAPRRVDAVIHADGSGRHDPAGPVPHDARLIGAKCHAEIHVASGRVAIRSAPGAYIGSIAVEDGRATCALVARSDLVRHHRGDFNALLDEAWPDRGWRDRPQWLACPLPRSGYRAPGHLRSFRIGNAAAAVDPVGGEGIANAIWSGVRVADLLVALGELSEDRLSDAQRQFRREFVRRLRIRGLACRAAAAALMRPGLVRAVWPMLAYPRLTVRPWYRLMGKPVS